MDSFEFFREQYLQENERRELMNNEIGTPMAIITGEITAMFILATTFSYKCSIVNLVVFLGLISLSLFFLVISAAYLSKVFVTNFPYFRTANSFSYQQVALPDQLHNWYLQLNSFFHSLPSVQGQNPEQLAEDEFKRGLRQQYADFAAHNAKINDRKRQDIFYSKFTILYSSAFLFVSIFPYGYSLVTKDDETYKVELVKNVKKLDKENTYDKSPAASKPKPDHEQSSKSASNPAVSSRTASGQVDKRRQGFANKKVEKKCYRVMAKKSDTSTMGAKVAHKLDTTVVIRGNSIFVVPSIPAGREVKELPHPIIRRE